MNNNSDLEAVLRERMKKAAKRVAMVAFARGDTANSVDDNGTASFIHFPNKKLIVTNHHVWDRFREVRDKDSNYKLALNCSRFGRPLDISDAIVVAESEQHDLCVLDYPPERIERLGKEFCVPPNWPPQRASKGDVVCFTGFPGMRRRAATMQHPNSGEEVSVLHHESCSLFLSVEAVSESQIRCVFESENPEILSFSGRPITELRWGGMSGSLVYRLDKEKNLFTPCGIFGASGDGTDTVFYATHLDKIMSDGSIASE